MPWLVRVAGLALLGIFATNGAAQQRPVDSAALLTTIQTDKRSLVDKAMTLSPEEAKRFWPLYERFQRELERPQTEYTRAVLDWVEFEGRLTNANADRLARQVLRASVNEARMRQRHYEELAKALPAMKVARYAQIENKLQAVQRFEAAKAVKLVE